MVGRYTQPPAVHSLYSVSATPGTLTYCTSCWLSLAERQATPTTDGESKRDGSRDTLRVAYNKRSNRIMELHKTFNNTYHNIQIYSPSLHQLISGQYSFSKEKRKKIIHKSYISQSPQSPARPTTLQLSERSLVITSSRPTMPNTTNVRKSKSIRQCCYHSCPSAIVCDPLLSDYNDKQCRTKQTSLWHHFFFLVGAFILAVYRLPRLVRERPLV